MNKILALKEGIKVAYKIKEERKTIVVAGGIFDILHLGHIEFLKNAKKHGDYLFVLLESDERTAREKGDERPINSQINRAKILSTLPSVDHIIMLKDMTRDGLYDRIMVEIKPEVIATTYGDPYINHKERQAELTGAKVVNVIKKIKNHSTTRYVKKLISSK